MHVLTPPPLRSEGDDADDTEYYVTRILKHDSKKDLYLVEWHGSNVNTWEPALLLEPNAKETIDEYWASQPRDIRRPTRQNTKKAKLDLIAHICW